MPAKQTIEVPGLQAIGPYSHAVHAAGLLFVSGQPGVDPSTGEASGSSFRVQARQAFKNLEMVLRAGGSRLNLVVNTTVLVTDISYFAQLNSLFAEFFPRRSSCADGDAGSAPERIAGLDWLCRDLKGLSHPVARTAC